MGLTMRPMWRIGSQVKRMKMLAQANMAHAAQRSICGRPTIAAWRSRCTLATHPMMSNTVAMAACGDNGEDRFKGVCDKNGCDIQPYRLKEKHFWGKGKHFQVDSSKPVTVTTQLITNDGTDEGEIVEVKQFYTQNGHTIEHPMYSVNGKKHNSISNDFCADWVADTKDGTNFLEKGGMKALDTIFENGGVLVMSLWDDHYANMLWLDSKYPVDGTCDQPGVCRGPCAITTGVPAD